MFNSKKAIALCATTIASISALGTLPQAVLADVEKAGDTVITYEGAPKPVDWGLSVPSTIKLDKSTDNGKTAWSSEKLEIVKDDGSAFSDTSKDRTFTVSGTPQKTTVSDRFTLYAEGNDKEILHVMMNALPQGQSKPTDWVTAGTGSGLTLDHATFDMVSKADGSSIPSRYWATGVHTEDASGLKKVNYTNTMSWTATEK